MSVALTLASIARLSAQPVTVGPNVQVSAQRPTIVHDEVTIAADPSNPNHLLACALVMPMGKEKMYDIAYRSLDGGKTWTVAVDLDEKFSADVDCTFGPDGSAYFTAHVFGKGLNPPPDAWIYRSPDGGRTWLPPSIVREVNDRQFLSIDHSHGPNRGRVYLSYRKNFYGIDADQFVRPGTSGLGLQVSTDAGRTWNLTAIRPALPGLEKVHAYPTYTVVLSDGTLVIPVVEWQSPDAAAGGTRKGAIKVFRSTDGGQTLLKSVTATEVRSEMVPHVSAFLPFVAVDPGSAAFKDRIYIAWADVRSGRWEIWFTYSTDKGVTWASPRIVSDDVARVDAPGPDDLNATLAVNKSGVVAVAWYDRRDNPDNLGWFVRLTASLDGGDTWLPSVRISEVANTFPDQARWPLDDDIRDPLATEPANLSIHLQSRTLYAGHTAGMAASAEGSFYPLWVDNRTGVPQAWTARVTVPGIAAIHGGGELAAFTDESSRIAVEMLNAVHDPTARTITATVRLRNRSGDPVRGPFKLRALSLKSDIGDVAAANASNNIAGPGAVWDLSDVVAGGRLDPDQASAEKKLVFHIRQTRPFKQGKEVKLTVIDTDLRILAAPQK